MNENQYSSPLPYPEIKVLEPNKRYAEILIEAYAGFGSELTAINQYIYHEFILDKQEKELKKLFKNIAIVEMKHLDILAELIKQLGVNPLFRGSMNNYWNSSFVYYGTDLCNRLESDIDAETKAIEHYNKIIEIIKDPYIIAVLKRIIIDEQIHLELYRKTIAKYNCQ